MLNTVVTYIDMREMLTKGGHCAVYYCAFTITVSALPLFE